MQKIGGAPSDGAACDEMALSLCELLHGSQCDVYQVEQTEEQEFLKVNHRVFLPVRYQGLLHRGDYTLDSKGGGKPVSYPFLDLGGHGHGYASHGSADKHEPCSVLEWYEPRHGYRELLVRTSEQDRVAATLRDRGYKAERVSYRLKEYGHAMVIPVWARPVRMSRSSKHSEVDDGEGDEPPTLVALIQLLRGPEGEPFKEDEEYLAMQLAPHLAHALRRSPRRIVDHHASEWLADGRTFLYPEAHDARRDMGRSVPHPT